MVVVVFVVTVRGTTTGSGGEVQILKEAPEFVFGCVEGQIRLTVVNVGMDPHKRLVLGLLLVLLFLFRCGGT